MTDICYSVDTITEAGAFGPRFEGYSRIDAEQFAKAASSAALCRISTPATRDQKIVVELLGTYRLGELTWPTTSD